MAKNGTIYRYHPTPYDDELERRLREFCDSLPRNRSGGRPDVIRRDHIRIENLDYTKTMKTWITVSCDRIYDEVCGLVTKHIPGEIVTIYRDPLARTEKEGEARLIAPVITHGYIHGGQLEQWVVEFLESGLRTTRLIHQI
jgi:hypothetical protein